MHSRVEIVAVRAGDGSTVLRRVHADGLFAVRRTGPGVAHLVGTAAGPLGGDVVEVRLHVVAGATLTVRSAAATIALPHRDGGVSQLLLDAVVEDGGHLDVGLEPLVVCRGADVIATTALDLHGTASAVVVEHVVLGRHGEDGGHWAGRTTADRDANALLRHTIRSSIAAPDGSGVRAVVSSVRFGAAPGTPDTPATPGPAASVGQAATFGQAAATPLAAGGMVVTSTGATLTAARADHDGALTAAGAVASV